MNIRSLKLYSNTWNKCENMTENDPDKSLNIISRTGSHVGVVMFSLHY